MKSMWKQMSHFEGQFWISNKGEVFNQLTERYIIGDVNNGGYYRVSMWHQKEYIRKFRHRLVAKNFIQNPENKLFVNHRDGVKSNNWVSNLEWVTQSENELHAFANNLRPSPNVRPYKVIFLNGEVKKYKRYEDLAIEIGVSRTTVGMWTRKERDTYKKHEIENIYYI